MLPKSLYQAALRNGNSSIHSDSLKVHTACSILLKCGAEEWKIYLNFSSYLKLWFFENYFKIISKKFSKEKPKIKWEKFFSLLLWSKRMILNPIFVAHTENVLYSSSRVLHSHSNWMNKKLFGRRSAACWSSVWR